MVDSFFYYSAPFSLSLLLLAITSGIICYSWTENYGDVSENVKLSTILQGMQVIRHGQWELCVFSSIKYGVCNPRVCNDKEEHIQLGRVQYLKRKYIYGGELSI